MSTSLQNVVARQVRQVRRRLWLGKLLQGLLAGWAGAFFAAMAYFVVHAAIWDKAPESHGWIALGVCAGVGAVLGGLWAWKRGPGTADSALALDETFALKERVTTYLSLTGAQAQSPAGQALLEDVHEKLAGLNVKDRFPIRLTWRQAVMPVLAGGLAVVAFFFSPKLDFSWAKAKDQSEKPLQANAEDAKKQLDNIKKDIAAKDKKDVTMSKEEKELDDKLNKLLEKDLDLSNDKQLRETLEAVRALEDQMKERIDELKEQAAKNKQTLDALAQLNKFKDGPGKDFDDALANGDFKKAAEEFDKWVKDINQDGIGKDLRDALDNGDIQKAEAELDKLQKKLKGDGIGKEFEDALARGDMKKAAEELDKLQKKLQNDELGKEDLERLAERLQDVQRQLQRLHDNQDLRDQLKEMLQKELDDGKITKEEMDRLLQELDRELEGMKAELADLQELAKLLDGLQEGLLERAEGNDADLKDLLEQLKAQLGKLGKEGLNAGEMARLMAEQGRLQALRQAMLRSMPGQRPNPASGARPPGIEPKDGKATDERVKADPNWKKARITGYAKGGNFSKIPAKEVPGSFQQAQQEASETIDRQRIPADAADITRGYFQRLGGQK